MMRIRLTLAAVVTTTLVAACGGGGGGSAVASAPVPVGGIDRSGQSVGVVTGFGSVFVNGIEFDTRQATITKNGQNAIERDLKIGQIVTVDGTRNDARTTGVAKAIAYRSNVEGPVTAVNLGLKQLTVLGQTVQVDNATVFEGVTPADIASVTVNDNVEVSGLAGANGVILATHIEKRAAPATLELRGVVSGVDTTAKRFSIGGQLIDYANATLVSFTNGAVNNGDHVEVRGPSPATNAPLQATRVEKEAGSPAGSSGAHSELEGLVTRFVSPSDFDVAGQKVIANASTKYEEGTAADIKLGARAQVEGTVDANGALVADAMQVKAVSNTRVAGTVTLIDSGKKQLTVLGQIVAVDAATQFEDKSRANKVPFAFADLATNDFVEVRGVPGIGGVNILATRVERQDAGAGGTQEVRGEVASIDAANFMFVVSGVTVTVDPAARLKDSDGRTVTRAAFFVLLRVNDEIRANGTSNGAKALTATEAELR